MAIQDIERCLRDLDWNSAIAEASREIEARNGTGTAVPANPAPAQIAQITELANAYRYRGIARCFKGGNKDGKYIEAIEDLSQAISLMASLVASSQNIVVPQEWYYFRAYIAFLDGDYDCAGTGALAHAPYALGYMPRHEELLGKIALGLNNYPEAVHYFRQAIIDPLNPDPRIIESYREACKGMNRR